MPKDDFYTPTDIDALRMENELLAFEVRFLKAQLAEPERTVAQLEQSKAQLEESRMQLETRLEGVETDLVSLLRSLATSPLGRFLRRKQEFRALEQRYLGTDA